MDGLAAGMPGLLAGLFLKSTAVLTLALAAAAAARRRPAAFRHFILSAALIGLLVLPLLTIAPIGWRAPLLPSWMSTAGSLLKGGPGPVSAGGAGLTPAQAAGLLGGRAGEATVIDPSRGNRSHKPIAAAADGAVALAGAPRPGRGSEAARPAGPAPDSAEPWLGSILLALWAAGAAALLLRLIVGLAGAVRLTAEGTPLEGPAWRALLDRFLALVAIGRPIRLRSHPLVLVPLTWGWRRPVVLLPDGADGWTEDERSAALWHELSHIKRADFAVMLLVRAGLALFWWNPLSWIAHRELLKEQEIACDDLVLRAGIRPSTYAASLLAFRRSAGLRWNPSAALLGLVGKSPFQERLAAILKQKLTFMEVKMKTKIMAALALVAAVALIGTARPAAGRETSGPAPTVLAEPSAAAASPLLPALDVQPGAQAAAGSAVAQEAQLEQEKAKAEKAKAAEKAKEAEKAQAEKKAELAKTVVIRPVVVEGKPITVVITENGTEETLHLEKPLTITKSTDGASIVLTVDGRDIQVLKDHPLRLEIKGGEVEVIRKGHALTHAEALKLRVAKEAGEEGGTIVFYAAEPGVAAHKIKHAEQAAAVEGSPEVFVKVRKDLKEGEKWVEAKPAEAGEAVVMVTEGKPAHAVKIVGAPGAAFDAAPGMAWTLGHISETKMLEKVQALQEMVAAIKAKKMDLAPLEESLKKLAAELEATEAKVKVLSHKLALTPGEVAVPHEHALGAEGRTFTWTTDGDELKSKVMVHSAPGETSAGAISLVFTGQEGPAGQAAFERAAAKLKKELPAGYEIAGQEFDADGGVATFKIAAPKDAKTDESLIKKLIEIVQSEFKK